ncbi:hypothetical protein [Chitinophaga rhizophila]|uniref:Uncharacterized protein n=1 Tax=Chitinophaga rhizophila TaxID=2866212 RepID=A0ABS7G6U4_9BACT|nr:hypothetical protein [Chitinophaga rhizophila]MBW8683366.1 hypothetical protein [Chitinophaga rhizophila]
MRHKMAKQTSLITFTGKLGNLIGYQRNRKYCLRSAPAAVRQTTATRLAAQRFGLASKTGALIRHALYPELDVRCDSTHINRLNKRLIQGGKQYAAALTGFRFNEHSGIEKFFSLPPVFTDQHTLHIPAQVLPQIKSIQALEVKLITVRIRFATMQVTGTDSATVLLTPGQPVVNTMLTTNTPGEGTLLVLVQVRGVQAGSLPNNHKWMAADIIAVVPPPPTESITSTAPDNNDKHRQHDPAQLSSCTAPAMTYIPVQRE